MENVSKNTVMRMGILEGSTVRTFVPCTIEAFTLTYLKSRMAEDGHKFNDTGRTAYVSEWKEYVDYDNPEAVTMEEAASEAAHILVYSNTMFIDMGKRQSVSTEVLSVMSEVIEEKLRDSIKATA